MKNLLLTTALLCSALLTFGQNYNYVKTTGTTTPYLYTNTGTTVLGIPSNEVMSSAQTIPFSFEFYGQNYTEYYASDNGYITFDNDLISDPNNTAIPATSGPNNAIYAFWDDLNISNPANSPDEVLSYTYGSTPNRVHVIQWFSPTPATGTGYLYTAIRLYECGLFDIMHNFGNATGMSATSGVENATGTIGVSITGSPNMTYPSKGIPSTDDDVYTFYWDGNNYDLALTSLNLGGMISQGSTSLTGTISNRGTQSVNSFDLVYTVDGGTPVVANINTTIAGSGGTYSFNHPTPWNVTSNGANHAVCIWVENLNGNTDEVPCNDEICVDVFTISNNSAVRNVVVEEFTGAWCGWCVDGAVILDSIAHANPDRVIPISIHSNDDMEFAEGVRTAFGVTGYPNAMIDRKVFSGETTETHGRGAWSTNVQEQLSAYTPVEVNISNTYDPVTRIIDVDITASFVDYIAGDMRIVLNIVEDSVIGTGSGYDQTNYTNTIVGHPFEGAGDPIIGYVHNQVLRANPSGVFGNAGVITSPAGAGDNFTESFQYTLPANFNSNKTRIVAFVAYYSTNIGEREILNGNQVVLNANTASITENDILQELNIFPNPASDQVTLTIDAIKEFQGEIIVYNAIGQKVSSTSTQTYNAGKNLIDVPVDNLNAGIYYISFKMDNKTYTRKLILK